MNKAVRFSTNSAAIAELNAYYGAIVMDAQIEADRQEQLERENAWLEQYFGRSSRAKWLMENLGLSILEAARQVQAEEEKWEKETEAWLHDPANFDAEEYSDIYKDLYGVRPHGYRPAVI
jgi:hypothetical protein